MPVDRPICSRRDALLLGAAALCVPGAAFASADPPVPESLDGVGPLSDFTLSNATLVLPSGDTVVGGVRVEAGAIADLGPGVKGGLDLGGDWLAAGIVDCGNAVGTFEVGQEGSSRDDDEASAAVTPDARIRDGYNPLSITIPVARSGGLTHALVLPGGNRLVPGQAALVRYAGESVPEAVLQPSAGLLVRLGKGGTSGDGPRSRMGVAMRLRELLDAVKLPEAAEATEESRRRRKAPPAPPAPSPDADLSPAERAWRAVRRGTLPVLFAADRADDLVAALELTKAYGLRAVLVGAAEGWVVADAIAAAGVPVLLGPVNVQPDGFGHPLARKDNAARLHAAGVRFCFRSGDNHNARQLRVLAGMAVAHGLPRSAAYAALGAHARAIFNEPALPRLEVGSRASFFRCAGEIIQPRHPVRALWIDGRPVSLESHQTRLRERFSVLR
jgi:hypothetical protein